MSNKRPPQQQDDQQQPSKKQKLTNEQLDDQQQVNDENSELVTKYNQLKDENDTLMAQLANIKKSVTEHEKNTQMRFEEVDRLNSSLLKQVNDLTAKLKRAKADYDERIQQENREILDLRMRIAQYELDKIEHERNEAKQSKSDLEIKRLKFQVAELLKDKENDEQIVSDKVVECETIQDLYSFMESLSGISAKQAKLPNQSSGDTVTYDCVCTSPTHILKFRIEGTDDGNAMYRPLSFQKIVNGTIHVENSWNELQDPVFRNTMVINSDLLAVFSSRMVTSVWSASKVTSFTIP